MFVSRRLFASTFSAALFALTIGAAASAQALPFPNKTITIVVPFPAGSSPDGLARLVAPRLASALGQPVIVDNRPGAGTAIAALYTASQPADGHTILFIGSTFTINATLLKRYDPKDFVPVAFIAESPLLIASNAGSRLHSLQDFIQAARANPESVSYGSFGIGTSSHVAMEQIADLAGVRFLHVPYTGITKSLPELVAGRIDVALGVVESMMPMVKEGRIRPLAIVGSKRVSGIPDVPTVAQAGVHGDLPIVWQGLAVRKGTPPDVIDKLNEVVNGIVGAADVRQTLEGRDMQVALYQPAALQKLVDEEVLNWGAVIRKSNIRAD